MMMEKFTKFRSSMFEGITKLKHALHVTAIILQFCLMFPSRFITVLENIDKNNRKHNIFKLWQNSLAVKSSNAPMSKEKEITKFSRVFFIFATCSLE